MYDKDNSGEVSIDETMTMLYQRYGKERLESELQKLFGKDLKTQDGDGELSFQEYLKVVEKRLPQETKKKSPKGKKGRGRRRK
jgi:Ca2+-binding EF-hand superfamily protein